MRRTNESDPRSQPTPIGDDSITVDHGLALKRNCPAGECGIRDCERPAEEDGAACGYHKGWMDAMRFAFPKRQCSLQFFITTLACLEELQGNRLVDIEATNLMKDHLGAIESIHARMTPLEETP